MLPVGGTQLEAKARKPVSVACLVVLGGWRVDQGQMGDAVQAHLTYIH